MSFAYAVPSIALAFFSAIVQFMYTAYACFCYSVGFS